jgi:macrocin-O-methyltransferase TylF-like protien
MYQSRQTVDLPLPANAERSMELYVDLLKRSLTNTIFRDEPDVNRDETARYVAAAIIHYQKSSAVSMLPLTRLDNLQFCITDVVQRGVRGDLVETGVWRGGATIFMRAMLKIFDVTDRSVWVADSFEGLPEPDAKKFPLEAQAFKSAAMTKYYKQMSVGLEEVRRNFQAYGMLDDQVKFLKGWFKDTLPSAPIESIAVLRLDGDYYESTRDALTNLYKKVSIGGYVIVDDYGEDSWTYCRQAVDEFRLEYGITDPMLRVDKPCVFWRKTKR